MRLHLTPVWSYGTKHVQEPPHTHIHTPSISEHACGRLADVVVSVGVCMVVCVCGGVAGCLCVRARVCV
jgi:hypothetical protein